MIKRSIPKKLVPVEHLTEDYTVGASGIDVTSPPTKQTTVYDMENLNVDLDAGISLRKPLLYNSAMSDLPSGSVSGFIFDDSKIDLYSDNTSTIVYVNIDNDNDIQHPTVYEDIDTGDRIPAEEVFFESYYGIYIENYGNVNIVTDRGELVPSSAVVMDNDNINIINTNTSTIIFGYKFNLSDPTLQHYAKNYILKTSGVLKNRPIKITKEDGVYKAEVLQIETPTMYVDSSTNTSRIYFNMFDDYTYSFKDNYHAGYTYCSGAIMYTPSDETLTNVSSYTVEELTESAKFKIVDSLTKEEVNKLYLIKAFISHTVTDTPGYSVYCTWEKSYDNVTWNPVEEFIAAQPASNIIHLDITDNTVSYETLENSYKYTRRVPFVPFNINSSQDFLGNRPDVLILNKIDSATYRFTLRSVAVPTVAGKNILTHTVKKVSGFIDFNDGLNYIAVNNGRDASFTINLIYTIKGNALAEANTNLRVMIRSIYDSNAGEDITSAERSFGDTLNNTTLDSLCDPTQALIAEYNKATDITTLTRSVTVPIHLTIGWIAQKMCLKIVLFDATQQVSDSNVICSDMFDAIVGFNTLGTPTDNQTFKYLPFLDSTVTAVNNASIVPNPNEDSACYGFTIEYDKVSRWSVAPRGWRNTSYDDNIYNLYMSIELNEVRSKIKLPIDFLQHLAHTFNTTPKLYSFKNYEYLLKNISVKFNLTIPNIFIRGTINDRFEATCNVWLTASCSLYEYLNFKNGATFTNVVMRSFSNNNYEYSFTLLWTQSTDTEWFSYLLERAFPSITEKILEDFGSKVDTLNTNLTFNNIVKFSYAPLVDGSPKSYDTFNIRTTLSNSETVFSYSNTWKYSTESNVIHLTNLNNEQLLTTSNTPESYTTYIPQFMKYESTYFQPFKYLTWFDTSSTPIQAMLKIGDVVNLKTIYEALTSSDSSLRYNVQYEVLTTSKYPTLSNQFYVERYSKELASFPYTALFTNVKQIDNYQTIDVYNSNKIYYNYRIWCFGKNLKNVIYFSNTDSTTTPMDNSLTLSTDTDDYVTALTPWKDYLVAMTKNKTFLITKYGDSYTFKQVNTFIGIPEPDSRTCKAILNGVIFKTGTKVLVLHPNMYSSDDTVLNITDISKPISHLLTEGTNNFAVATEYYYYLFIPRTTDTLVFKYEYTRKIWSKFTYPVILSTAKLMEVHNILVIDVNGIVYDFDKSLDWFKKKHNLDYLEYGDYLTKDLVATPISFYLDTGQKSSNMQFTKQFTESKFIIATVEVKDSFPIKTTIYVDGVNLIASHKHMLKDMQVITTDPNTDGSFSKTNPEDIGYLNTNVINDSGDTFNVMRQMILRYMGKGKTLRHVLEGSSSFNFKIYVLYYRYRIPHNKQ
jgi:hypothetical protein